MAEKLIFVTIINDEMIDLIEVKLSDVEPSTSLVYYKNKLNPKRAMQIVGNYEGRSYHEKDILIMNPIEFADFKWDKEKI